MASTKKSKKTKGKTIALNDFLQDSGPVSTQPIRKSNTNWADEVEDSHDMYESRSKVNVILPTAPKASRDIDDINSKIPQNPPFLAYLSNLPYDVDEEEISYFFKNMKIANMRIPKDDRTGDAPKLKGFGYIEFEDRESLLNALVIPDTTLKNRRIRIEVATDYDDKRRSGRGDMNRDRQNRSDAPTGDWRSGPARAENPDNDQPQRRTYGGGRDGGGGRDRDRERDDTPGAWRNDNDNRGNDNRDGERSFSRSTNDRYNSNRDSDYDRFRSNDKDDRQGFTSRKYDNNDSSKMGSRGAGGGFTRSNIQRDDTRDDSRMESRQRPKLVLAPRSKAVVENVPEKSVPMTSIFGNAKPVDTSARERQIEERLAKEHDNKSSSTRELSRSGHNGSNSNNDHKEKYDDNHRDDDDEDVDKVDIIDDGNIADVDSSSQEKGSINLPSKEEIERNNVSQDEEEQNVVKDQEELLSKKIDELEKSNIDDSSNDVKQQQEQLPKVVAAAAIDNKGKRDEKKGKSEKAMPKIKKMDPPNFIANNKFAFLQNEDNSD